MVAKMTQALRWLRAWSWTLVLGLLAIVGVGWAARRRNAELGRVRDELAVERAQRAISELRGRRDQLLAEVAEDHALVRSVDAALAENARKLAEAHEGVSRGMPDAEVAEALRKLGY